ncbi:glutamate synthase-related protein [Francisella tularensis]|uniref:glutamate synthase-related protein n=1 Tax=Francisella tularensis TaxID=263 RepID=UPI0016814742|nr:glutamate synthase-related protein [Francisella tularensis]MBD2809229.1 hypothetical protein [Francisella tularensis]
MYSGGVRWLGETGICASSEVAAVFDIVRLCAMGAETCNSARAMILAIGCTKSRHLNNNNCPDGVSKQNPRLETGLVVDVTMYRLYNYTNCIINY